MASREAAFAESFLHPRIRVISRAAVDALTEVARLGLRADLPWFGRTLDRYRLALEE